MRFFNAVRERNKIKKYEWQTVDGTVNIPENSKITSVKIIKEKIHVPTTVDDRELRWSGVFIYKWKLKNE